MRRAIAVTLITAFTLTGCASTSPEVRANWDTPGREPAAVSDEQFAADNAACDKEAKDNSSGYSDAGTILTTLGILVWPVGIPGIVLSSVGLAKSASAKTHCMAEKGYTRKSGVSPQTPPTPMADALK